MLHRLRFAAALVLIAAPALAGNPCKGFDKAGWTDSLAWDRVVDVTAMPGATVDARTAAAIAKAADAGGGVVVFPACATAWCSVGPTRPA